ncbi:Uncharacterized protein OBRU01_06549, partial [Operophtera brumata]
ACIDYDGWLNIEIQHNLNCNNGNYCKRGSVSLKSIRAGTSVVDQIQFNKNHIEELNGSEFLSSVKARSFLESGLSDLINAWILPTGAVIAVNFQWMYIVPVAIFVMISGATNPDAGGPPA